MVLGPAPERTSRGARGRAAGADGPLPVTVTRTAPPVVVAAARIQSPGVGRRHGTNSRSPTAKTVAAASSFDNSLSRT